MSSNTVHKPRPVRTPRPNVPRLKPLPGAKATPTSSTPKPGQKSSKTSAATCPNPGCPGSKVEQHGGELICVECGVVVSETNIVSEVQFGETAGGAAVVEGVFLGPNEGHIRSTISGGNRIGLNTDSREKSDGDGRRRIGEIGTALNINPQTQTAAFNIWKLCTAVNFIQGRRINHVAAVCLYIACRKMEHENRLMLIDFSDLISVNVFKLGHVYTTMLKTIGPVGGVPNIVIENLVYRFVEKLDFAEAKIKVASDAVRIVQRMKKDWMAVGRRPAGVVGASVVMAARMNNFRRSIREIVHVAKVTDMTINKRLEEFKVTASAGLTIDEFRVMELEREHDPPAFYEDRTTKKRKRGKGGVETTEQDDGEQVEQRTPSRAGSARPESQSQTPRVDKDGFAIPAAPIDPDLLQSSTGQQSETPPATAGEPQLQTPTKRPRGRPPKKPRAPPQPTPEEEAEQEALVEEIENLVEEAEHGPTIPPPIAPSPTVIPFDADSRPPPTPPATQIPIPTSASDPALTSPLINDSRSAEHSAAYARAASVASQLVAIHYVPAPIPDTPIIPSDELDSDPDIANCLLTADERAIKERIWTAENADYLRAKQAKEIAAEIAEKEGARKGIKRRKRTRKGKIGADGDETSGAATPQEAAKMMLQRRGFSTRINYDAVERMLSKERRGRVMSRRGSEASTSSSSSAAPGSVSVVAAATGLAAEVVAEDEGLRRAVADAVGEVVRQEGEGEEDEELEVEEEEEEEDESLLARGDEDENGSEGFGGEDDGERDLF